MKQGLKGVTDATVFCKSMKKGSPAPMIRSMKSYEVGGMTDTMSECAGPGRGKKRCKQKFKSKGKSQDSKGGILGTVGAALAGTAGALWMKNQREK